VIVVLTSKRMMLLLVLVGAVAILLSGSREWVSGSGADANLGAGVLHARGSDVAPGALAAALVGLVSAVAVATSRPVVRVVAACAALLAALMCAAVVIGILADPGGALGRLAAAGTGRSGTVAAHGRAGGWAWFALGAAFVMGAGGFGALVGGRHWLGLSSRYDAPAAGEMSRRNPTGEQGSGHDSAWDQLSRGEDPTDGH
jgi:uncharacterized membrane protein (TIGR02234 family)